MYSTALNILAVLFGLRLVLFKSRLVIIDVAVGAVLALMVLLGDASFLALVLALWLVFSSILIGLIKRRIDIIAAGVLNSAKTRQEPEFFRVPHESTTVQARDARTVEFERFVLEAFSSAFKNGWCETYAEPGPHGSLSLVSFCVVRLPEKFWPMPSDHAAVNFMDKRLLIEVGKNDSWIKISARTSLKDIEQ